MDNPRISVYSELLEIARRETSSAAGNVPVEKRLFQLREGKATPMWLIGHLANTVNTIILCWMLGGESQVDRSFRFAFAPDFAGGTPPSTDPALYPVWEEVLKRYEQIMQQAIDGVRLLPDSSLEEPLQGNVPDALRPFFPTVGAALARLIAHDAYHRGQMNLLAKY